ncbi:hypothetical protein GY45DRAFT_1376075 [Cubamyces sp. BRFM 1775]|nr:hypothetical protein GY45DRAFT_1376075 [Cubamyces sp. BRFM 1775]
MDTDWSSFMDTAMASAGEPRSTSARTGSLEHSGAICPPAVLVEAAPSAEFSSTKTAPPKLLSIKNSSMMASSAPTKTMSTPPVRAHAPNVSWCLRQEASADTPERELRGQTCSQTVHGFDDGTKSTLKVGNVRVLRNAR